MKQFLELRLKKYVLFEDPVTLKLNVPGVTLVYGNNTNAGPKSSNASGKSLLLSSIPQVRYDTNPLTSDIKTRAKKDAWESGTSVELDVQDGEHVYTLAKRMEKSSFRYEIFRDGKPAKTRESEYAKEQFAKRLPWSELEYFTYVHIDSSRPNLLRVGSPAQRLEFFSEVFRLNSIDEQRKWVKQQLDAIRDKALIRKELERSLLDLTKRLEEYDQIDDEVVEKIRARITKYNGRLSKAQARKVELMSVRNVEKAYKRVTKVCGSTREDIAEWLDGIEKQLRKLAKQIDSCKAWEAYDEALLEFTRRKADTETRIQNLLPASWFSEQAEDQESWVGIYRQRNDDLVSFTRERDEYLQESHDAPGYDPCPEVEDLEAETETCSRKLSRESVRIASTRKLLKSFESHFDADHTAECPTCANKLTPEEQKAIGKSLQEQLKRREEKQASLEGSIRLLEESAKYRKAQELQVKIERLTKRIKRESKREKASRELLDMDFPVKPRTPVADRPEGNVEALESEYNELRKTKDYAELLLPVADVCKKYMEGGADIKALIQEVAESIEAAEAKLEGLNSKWTDIEATIRVRKKLQEEIDSLKQRVSENEEGTEDADLWDILYDALGNKGLKTLLVQQLAKRLEINMNKLAPLLLLERTHFEFVVEGVQFHILATRKVDGKVRTTDVRNMSGAESRAFSFLLAVALIPLLPSERLSNLMVLDEPTTNMDEPFVGMFCSQFIPKLSQLVKSLIVISPLKLDIAATRTVTVTKKGRKSTVAVKNTGE